MNNIKTAKIKQCQSYIITRYACDCQKVFKIKTKKLLK